MTTGHRLPALAATLLLAFAPAAGAALTFEFDYSDPSAGLLPPEARAALANAGQRVASYFANHTADITISVTAFHDPNDPRWAAAGTNWNLTGGTPGFANPGVTGTKILTNGAVDQNGDGADGVMVINMGDWYGYDDNVDSSLSDFTTTMMHELGHVLGFFGNISQQGTTLFEGYYTPYCEFLTNAAGQKIVTFNSISGLWEVNVPLWQQASVGGTGNGLYFDGPNAVAANGGNLVALSSQQIWIEGDNMNHPDGNVFTNSIMSGWGMGTGPRDYSAVELGMLRDFGYDIVPEPGSGLLLLLPALGAAARRRRSTPSSL